SNLDRQKKTPRKSVATRAEIPVAKPLLSPVRQKATPLVRMAIDEAGRPVERRAVPWGLIVLGTMLLVVTLIVRNVIHRYSIEQDLPSTWSSPYTNDHNFNGASAVPLEEEP
ncbi:MAG TPA: hypothetical protein VNQ76_22460, partial [Planctomicrobium sp.]|nr:hypothetical protein [Planctomicrobium sp.]